MACFPKLICLAENWHTPKFRENSLNVCNSSPPDGVAGINHCRETY